MRYATPFLILLIITFTAQAEPFYDEWIISGNSFAVAGETHHVAYSTSNEKIYWQSPQGNFLLSVASCKAIEETEYCFTALDTEERVVYSEGTMYPALHLTVETQGSEVTITSAFSHTPEYGEDVTFTVSAQNEGGLDADGFTLSLTFPPSVQIMSTSGIVQGNKVTFTDSSLRAATTETYSVNIRPIEFGTHIITGNYDYLGNDQPIPIDSNDFEIDEPFTVTWSLTPQTLKRNEKANLTIIIENKDDTKALTVESFAIKVPPELIIVSSNNQLLKEGTLLTYHGNVAKNNKVTLTAGLKLDRGGSYTVVGTYNIQFDQHTFTKTFNTTLGSGIDRITPLITLDESKLKENGLLKVIATLKNNGGTISNITVQTSGDLLAKTSIDKINLDTGEIYTVLSKSLSLPPVDESTEYKFTISGTYKENGQTNSFIQSKTFIHQPEDKIITALHEAPRRAEPGESILIKVSVENQITSELHDVDVVDTVPDGFEVSNGSFLTTIPTIASKEKVQAMQYTLVIPADFAEESFTISTLMNAQREGSVRVFKYTDKFVIHISDEEEVITKEPVIEPVLNQTINTPEPDVQENKPSIFVKFWSWIKGLFTKENIEPVLEPTPEPTKTADDSELAKRFAEQQV